ncbi:MAG: tRNA(His) guanylyltransferase Thg1 family protein, partial [Rhabdochlamydiaceae bacterium]
MKMYEGIEVERFFIPTLPILARIDGRCFSSFTEGLERPYDVTMSSAMIKTTEYLVKETNARCGYTQSDEITLVWWEPDRRKQLLFNGRIQKLNSIIASMATIYFFDYIKSHPPLKYSQKLPVFDCRVWQVPSITEAANTFLWRELDASKNSISMAVSHYYKDS